MADQFKYHKNLADLIEGSPNIEIKGLFFDSRQKMEDAIFFCVKGLVSDGHNFTKEAISNGAKVIVYEDELEFYDKNVIYIKVASVLDSLNKVAASFYADPSSKLNIYAVTGTNGKTTIASLISNILNNFQKAGYIGTINTRYGNKIIQSQHTTPDAITLQSTLAKMQKADVKSVAVEISSHALEQKRVGSLKVNVAIYSNLSHEHLDYHGDMDTYFLAKSKLFSNLSKNAKAIINIDDDYGERMLEKSSGENITYAIERDADYKAFDIVYKKDYTSFKLKYKEKVFDIKTNLVAKFNVYNLLAALAALSESGLKLDLIIPLLENLQQVAGRVETVDLNQSFKVIVDYAHTPDGFEKIFSYADAIKEDKKIIAVFGSAGKRDIVKRSILGEIADKYCDMIILTEDDPRQEGVRNIANQIAEGIEGNYVIIDNRYDAIYQAVELANAGDVILLLGKGSDKYMARADKKEFYPGDKEIVTKIIKEYIIDFREEEY